MTALFSFMTENQLVLAMDSLSLTADSHRPFRFATKFHVQPHLRSVICGTGHHAPITHWASFVQTSLVGSAINVLGRAGQEVLPTIWEQCRLPEGATTTIYQYGVDRDEQVFKGFVHRSTNNFVAEAMDYDIRVKPYPIEGSVDFIELNERFGTIGAIVELFKLLKRQDEEKPTLEQVGIGGEIYVLNMDVAGNISIVTAHTFEDFQEHWSAMLDSPWPSFQRI